MHQRQQRGSRVKGLPGAAAMLSGSLDVRKLFESSSLSSLIEMDSRALSGLTQALLRMGAAQAGRGPSEGRGGGREGGGQAAMADRCS